MHQIYYKQCLDQQTEQAPSNDPKARAEVGGDLWVIIHDSKIIKIFRSRNADFLTYAKHYE